MHCNVEFDVLVQICSAANGCSSVNSEPDTCRLSPKLFLDRHPRKECLPLGQRAQGARHQDRSHSSHHLSGFLDTAEAGAQHRPRSEEGSRDGTITAHRHVDGPRGDSGVPSTPVMRPDSTSTTCGVRKPDPLGLNVLSRDTKNGMLTWLTRRSISVSITALSSPTMGSA